MLQDGPVVAVRWVLRWWRLLVAAGALVLVGLVAVTWIPGWHGVVRDVLEVLSWIAALLTVVGTLMVWAVRGGNKGTESEIRGMVGAPAEVVAAAVANSVPGVAGESLAQIGRVAGDGYVGSESERRLSSARPSGVVGIGLDGMVDRPGVGERLLAELATADTAPVVLTGAGGFGKTTLARWACAQVGPRFPDGIYWFRLSDQTTQANLIEMLGDLAVVLDGGVRRERAATLDGAMEACATVLGERRMLLVVDGVCRRAHLDPFLVGGPRCVRLVTTRRTGLVRGRELTVDAMTGAEAAALLCRNIDSSVEPPVTLLGSSPHRVGLVGVAA